MNIKIGQYIAGDSFLHRLDPRIKILSMLLLIISIFVIPVELNPVYIGFMIGLFLFSIGLTYLSGIPLGKVMQGLKAIVFLLTFTFMIQLFTIQPADETPFVNLPMTLSIISIPLLVVLTIFYHFIKHKIKFKTTWFFIYVILAFVIQWAVIAYIPNVGLNFDYDFMVYPSGLLRAGFIFLRIVSVMIIASLLTFTTSTIELNDGLESLMKPLRLIKIPTYIFSMMISLTLRSIPTLLEETEKILKAQTSRGADFAESSFKDKIGQIIALLIPVFVISFNRAEDLSNAMEARGYIIGAPRTKIDTYKIDTKDIVTMVLMSILLISVVVIRYAV
ncbi:energy-coupling factor transporter transmembrane protein EcfT [Acholeplasma equirhinis]|uniref:energy-coupling factor transporter transmembrane component T family protein n=1 Tax=Acholeplasma equirhinis TaxID=555393 RepID=UPI00197AE8CC|nr:energy-coupling factor transporter transmembrane component T [Acholeplasma equirhinis]MBN3490917.1 energy-coupling factor transporter transmembrane protein EcfT [Acholeplasma equirhinis]